MMVDKQKLKIMNEEEDAKALEAICKFYKFRVSFKEDSSILLKTAKRKSFIYLTNKLHPYELLALFTSIHEVTEKILTWADTFEVLENFEKHTCKNIFLGCKTLEDVLIMKDLHSVEEIKL